MSPWFSKVRFGLSTAPFIGMIVRTPSPMPHLPFEGSVYVEKDGIKQDRDFCWWFENLSFWEVTDSEKVVEGAAAYRLTQITPTCEAAPVQFRGVFGWLTDKEWKSQLQHKL
ncbi:MAG: hypothetical protein HYS57_03380 [Parcubacteria group bacterium]|nr:hypothetical protein [Parcubacteria group bacterium]